MANFEYINPPTGNPYLDSLIWGGHWIADADDPGRPQVAYWLADGSDFFGQSTSVWSAAEVSNFETALQLYANVCNIEFARVFSQAETDIEERLAPGSHEFLDGALGRHEVPDPNNFIEPLFGYYDNVDSDVIDRTQGSLGFLVFIHELGHALGLAHPHDGGPDGQIFPGVSFNRPYDTGDLGLNQGIWTTMSYNEGWNRVPPFPTSYGYQGTPMAFDIAALQLLYGANTTFNDEVHNVYTLPGVNGSGTFWSCIWDAGGADDEISGAGLKGACAINLNDATLQPGDPNAGGFVSWGTGIRGGFTIANGVVIENATGGNGNDTLTGNEFVNILAGNAGNDSLIGGLGADMLDGGVGKDAMLGGDGDDLYIVDIKTDKVTESLGAGDDTVESIVTYALAANVEKLVLTSGDTKGTGNVLDNLIVGSDGNNTLDGKEGGDTLRGGLGNDVYLVDGSDTVDEAGGGGTDTVQFGADFDLGTLVLGEIENLTLTGRNGVSGTGNALGNGIAGNSGANLLDGKGGDDLLAGGSGNDSLDGGIEGGDDTLDGGAGNDTMIGRAGDDTYGVNSTKDVVVEDKGGGIDTIQATIAIVLADYADIENVTLLGKAAIGATGDASANHLIGNDGANILDGGAGIDVMEGNKGNDTYKVDDGKDQVIEVAAGGTDTVLSIADYTLLDPDVENLTLLGAAQLGIGNAAKNKLTGNDGANTLDGGAAADTLIGGKGDDTYRVDETKDVVTETSGKDSGTDTVASTAAVYTLGANVENLTLVGTGDIGGTGNTLNNVLTGNSGDNTLNGGAGADTMNGGLGDDTYVYDGKDTISDDGGFDIVQASIAIDLSDFVDIEGVRLTGAGALAATGDDGANLLVGNSGANKLAGGDGADTIEGAAGNDTIDGGAGNDTLTGGAGADRIDVGIGNDTVFYTSKLDGKDIIDDFDGNETDGQDVLSLDLLFDSLGVADGDRAGRVSFVVNATGTAVDVKVNAADANPNFELTVATLNTVDAITIGADVVVGTL